MTKPAEGLSPGWQVIVFGIVALAIFSRRPDMFLRAQFYAEDGKFWFAQAYNSGWLASLRIPQAGYFQTFPRLIAGLTLLFPLRFAPLIMNLAGLVIQALPVTALLSARCRTWGSLPVRICMAALYVAMPDKAEIHVVVTNAQWHLVVLEMLLAFSVAPRTRIGCLVDMLIFTIGGLTGPFSLLISPLVFFYRWKRRQSWTLVLALILTASAMIQSLCLLLVGRPKIGELGATPDLLVRIIGGDIFLDGFIGPHLYPVYWPLWPLAVAAVVGLALYLAEFFVVPLELKLFSIFAVVLFTLAMHAPFTSGSFPPAWQQLLAASSCRYWYYPILTLVWMTAWCNFNSHFRLLRLATRGALVCMLLGIVDDWHYRPFDDHHFAAYDQQLQQASPGQHVIIPIYPDPYTMELVKRRP